MKRSFRTVVFVFTILSFSLCNMKKEKTCLFHTTVTVNTLSGPNMVSVNHETDLTV